MDQKNSRFASFHSGKLGLGPSSRPNSPSGMKIWKKLFRLAHQVSGVWTSHFHFDIVRTAQEIINLSCSHYSFYSFPFLDASSRRNESTAINFEILL